MGFPKIRGYLLGGPYDKDYSVLGSILGPLILGNYQLFSLIGFIRTLYTNIFERVPKANQIKINKEPSHAPFAGISGLRNTLHGVQLIFFYHRCCF